MGFYLNEFLPQPHDPRVEAFLLLKVIIKEFAHMNSRDE
jgi:hypothetical protein